VAVTCHGYDTEQDKDVLLPYTVVSIWMRTEGSTSEVFEYKCKDPQTLWNYLRELTINKLEMLDIHFGYQPPKNKTVKTIHSIPLDLGDLFK